MRPSSPTSNTPATGRSSQVSPMRNRSLRSFITVPSTATWRWMTNSISVTPLAMPPRNSAMAAGPMFLPMGTLSYSTSEATSSSADGTSLLVMRRMNSSTTSSGVLMSGSLAHVVRSTGLDRGPQRATPLVGRGAGELVGDQDAVDNVGDNRHEGTTAEPDRHRGAAVAAAAQRAVAPEDPR